MPAISPPLRCAAPATNSVSPTGRELGRAVGAVRGAALHEHRPLDAVPAADVGEQVGEAVRERSAGGQR